MSDSIASLFWTGANGAVQRTDIHTRPVTVGSQPMCTISLEAEHVAAVHAVVGRSPDGNVVRRLSRTEPLVVGDEEVDERPLAHGDRVAVGDAEVIYLEPQVLAPQMLRVTLTREDAPGTVEVTIGSAVTVVGREDGNLVIHDGTVSGTHMMIENFGDGLMWVSDLGSTNGSELNGEPLVDRRPLSIGDVVYAGRIVMNFSDGGEPPPEIAEFPQQTVTFPDESLPA